MVDAITSSLQSAGMSRTASTETVKKPEPSNLELGSDNLTRNPRNETANRFFSRPSGNVFSSLESFVVAQEARDTRPSAENSRSARQEQGAGNKNAGFDLFLQRETSAEARLKELLSRKPETFAPEETPTVVEEEDGIESGAGSDNGFRSFNPSDNLPAPPVSEPPAPPPGNGNGNGNAGGNGNGNAGGNGKGKGNDGGNGNAGGNGNGNGFGLNKT